MKTTNRNNLIFPSIFDGLFTENRLDVPNYEKFSIPAVNISEKSANFVIEMAVPGIAKEDITIEVEENSLKVSSKSNDKEFVKDSENSDLKFTRKEFNYGKFRRTFTLPETVDTENIDATYNAGILAITLPKMEEKKALKKMVEIS
jgi:HSP20 family protein|tara:strand:- start:59375 stop:59812 length:438 start_codon:yes stop_codon:yes gene_type:complete